MIYIHIPFCRSFCTYCSFYSEVAARCHNENDSRLQESVFSKFGKALCDEISLRGKDISDKVNTLYIGGGTPSVLPLSIYDDIIAALSACGHGTPYDEFTVEVNPDDIVEKGEAYVEGLMKLGVNRISMGVQSFDDNVLRFMNRRHDSAAAVKAYGILERAGIRNISIDLIFGLPQLSDSQWEDTLKRAMAISSSGSLPQHISAYQLSVEPGSALSEMVNRGLWNEASDELCRKQYMMLCDTLHTAGYKHYEISNFALPGFEAKHNSAYWKHIPYMGFGPGAHSMRVVSGGADPVMGCISGESVVRNWNEPDLKSYLEDFSGIQGGERLNSEQVVLERIMLGLRTSEGVEESFLRRHCDIQMLEKAIADGDLVPVSGMSFPDEVSRRLRIPESRFFISDNIIAGLV